MLFRSQVSFLETHPDVAILGTWAREIDADDVEGRIYRTPTEQVMILWRACFANPFIHPTVVVRAGIFKANKYNEAFNKSQDFELWSRLLFQEKIGAANLPEELLRYRRHASSLTKNKKLAELERSARIPLANIATFYKLTPTEESLFIRAYTNQRLSITDLWARVCLSSAIKRAFLKVYPEARGKLNWAVWRDRWFFAKYGLKQFIRG